MAMLTTNRHTEAWSRAFSRSETGTEGLSYITDIFNIDDGRFFPNEGLFTPSLIRSDFTQILFSSSGDNQLYCSLSNSPLKYIRPKKLVINSCRVD